MKKQALGPHHQHRLGARAGREPVQGRPTSRPSTASPASPRPWRSRSPSRASRATRSVPATCGRRSSKSRFPTPRRRAASAEEQVIRDVILARAADQEVRHRSSEVAALAAFLCTRRRRVDHRRDPLDRRRLDRARMNAPQRDRARRPRSGRTVGRLVLQGGGALGAYQVGVYEALHERRHRARLGDRHVDRRDQRALIAGNAPRDRLRAAARVLGARRAGSPPVPAIFTGLRCSANVHRHARHPRVLRARSPGGAPARRRASGVERPRTTTPRRCARRSASWSIFEYSDEARTRLTVGAVNVRSGEMRYFDSRDAAARARARHGLGRAAAGLPGASASTASRTGTAASTPTRRSRRCSTTSRGATR